MQNVLRNLGRRSSTPQDTVNSNSDTIDNSGVLPRGMEHSALLDIELSPVDMYAAAADEGGDMSVGGVSVGRAPAGSIIHQCVAKLSLGEADLYEGRLEEMRKGENASTNLKTAPPPLNKGRAVIEQSAFQVGNCVEVAEYLSAGIKNQVKKFNQTTRKYDGPVVCEAGDLYLVYSNVTRLRSR